MSTAYLSLGSNIEAEHHIRSAVRALYATFAECRLSPIYRSRAVGFTGDDFINLIAAVETHLSPLELRQFLRDLEDRFQRDRSAPKFSDRTLDIDILLYGDLALDHEELKLPRPEILRFAHVLRPLADLAPDLVHPVEGRPMSELWRASGLQDVVLEEIELDFAGAREGAPDTQARNPNMTRTAMQVLVAWRDHVDHVEVDDAVELYADHATLLPTFSPHSLAGTEEIRGYFEKLATRQNLRVELHDSTVREAQIGENTYVLTGVYSFHFDVDDENLSFPSRFTFVIDTSLERPILHHHSSQVPRTLS